MCKYGYYKICEKTNLEMIYCELAKDKKDEFEKLCVSQRYCINLKKYIEQERAKSLCDLYSE